MQIDEFCRGVDTAKGTSYVSNYYDEKGLRKIICSLFKHSTRRNSASGNFVIHHIKLHLLLLRGHHFRPPPNKTPRLHPLPFSSRRKKSSAVPLDSHTLLFFPRLIRARTLPATPLYRFTVTVTELPNTTIRERDCDTFRVERIPISNHHFRWPSLFLTPPIHQAHNFP
ncbi:hypothetical protein CDAR_401701 [Caerostris darwini]|uniref:Uncharacterized protein n=1 Tax=Caerostris darwini TaxID=1538125 RepID=A0AAV4RWG7_9ARAC|nr:hypothetical protein CDAR_401701 [Caerostris darwini]